MQARNFLLPVVFAIVAAAGFIFLNILSNGNPPAQPLASLDAANNSTTTDPSQSVADQGASSDLNDGIDENGGANAADSSDGQTDASVTASQTSDSNGNGGETTQTTTTTTVIVESDAGETTTSQNVEQNEDPGQTAEVESSVGDTGATNNQTENTTVTADASAATTENTAAGTNATPASGDGTQDGTVAADANSTETGTVDSPTGGEGVADAGNDEMNAPVTAENATQASTEMNAPENTAEYGTDNSSQPTVENTAENDPLVQDDPGAIDGPHEEPLGLIIELTQLDPEEQPRFGRTKIENSGNVTIIRGKGVPGTRLELLANEAVVAETNVDGSGAWNLYESGALEAGLQVLTLRSSLSDGRIGLSDDVLSVVVDPASNETEVKIAVLTSADGDMSLLSGPRFVTQLQAQGVRYSSGNLSLTGKAPAGSEVLFVASGMSVDDAPSALIGGDGSWLLVLEDAGEVSGDLIQRNPVTGDEVARQALTIPARPELAAGQVETSELGTSLAIGEETLIFF